MGKRMTVDTETEGKGWIEMSREVGNEVENLVYNDNELPRDALVKVLRGDYPDGYGEPNDGDA
jgi:hypothetical protein